MAVSSESEEYRDPFGVTYDDEENHVRIMIVIPGLTKALLNNKKPKNGNIDFKVKERSFDMIISTESKASGSKKEVKYRYHVKQLPGDIIPSKSEYKVQDGKVLLKIYKSKIESWAATLSDVGLDTYHEEEETPAET